MCDLFSVAPVLRPPAPQHEQRNSPGQDGLHVPENRPHASTLQNATEASSRGWVHLACSASWQPVPWIAARRGRGLPPECVNTALRAVRYLPIPGEVGTNVVPCRGVVRGLPFVERPRLLGAVNTAENVDARVARYIGAGANEVRGGCDRDQH